jgi:hypothetical protein
MRVILYNDSLLLYSTCEPRQHSSLSLETDSHTCSEHSDGHSLGPKRPELAQAECVGHELGRDVAELGVTKLLDLGGIATVQLGFHVRDLDLIGSLRNATVICTLWIFENPNNSLTYYTQLL